jgi:hypothetical protein
MNRKRLIGPLLIACLLAGTVQASLPTLNGQQFRTLWEEANASSGWWFELVMEAGDRYFVRLHKPQKMQNYVVKKDQVRIVCETGKNIPCSITATGVTWLDEGRAPVVPPEGQSNAH